jgi:hypothetical protein
MAVPATPQTVFTTVGVGAFILWRVYSRVRRMVGRQRLSTYRPWLTVTLFPLLLALLSLGALRDTLVLAYLVAGIAAGVGLGLYGLRLTRYEVTPQGLFYTPNAHLGIALSLLMLGRIGYRVLQVTVLDPGLAAHPGDFARSPVTLAIFGTLAGYYVCYAVGLLRWRAEQGRSDRSDA